MSYLLDRGGGKCVTEIGAVAGQTIQLGGLYDRVPGVSQGVPGLVVGQYEDDVRSLGRRLSFGRQGVCASAQDAGEHGVG